MRNICENIDRRQTDARQTQRNADEKYKTTTDRKTSTQKDRPTERQNDIMEQRRIKWDVFSNLNDAFCCRYQTDRQTNIKQRTDKVGW